MKRMSLYSALGFFIVRFDLNRIMERWWFRIRQSQRNELFYLLYQRTDMILSSKILLVRTRKQKKIKKSWITIGSVDLTDGSRWDHALPLCIRLPSLAVVCRTVVTWINVNWMVATGIQSSHLAISYFPVAPLLLFVMMWQYLIPVSSLLMNSHPVKLVFSWCNSSLTAF